MSPIRPDGMVERLDGVRAPSVAFSGYGRAQPGPQPVDSIRLAAEQDRRRKRRNRPDPFLGRLIDLTT